MFVAKIKSKASKLFIAISLILLVASNSIALLHGFSHQELNAIEVTATDTSSLQAEPSHKSFFEKIIFAHEKSSGKEYDNCFLCTALNSQNQIFLTPNFIFATAIFYVVFVLRYLNRTKLSYLLFSKSPRAPPVIS